MSRRALTGAAIGALFVLGAGGCASLGPFFQSNGSPAFNPALVRHYCARLGCREPNTVVARYFSGVANGVGRACVVHISPESGPLPRGLWSNWGEYVSALRSMLVGSRVEMFGYSGAGSLRPAQRRHLTKLEGLYARHGARVDKDSPRVIVDAAQLVPPYRAGPCRGRLVLEIFEGARIVSYAASASAEKVKSRDRGLRTVLVTVDDMAGGANR